MTSSRWRPTPRRLARLLTGLVLFGIGDALLIDAALGTSPWTVLSQGVALRTPLSVGVATQLIGAAVLLAWLPLRERPGLGTLLNVVVIGAVIDLARPFVPEPATLLARWALLLAGIAIVGLGSGLYLTARLGPGPRDGLMTSIARRSRRPVALVRVCIEVSVLLAGWALGGVVGLGTLAFAVLIGPAVATGLRLLGGLDAPAAQPEVPASAAITAARAVA